MRRLLLLIAFLLVAVQLHAEPRGAAVLHAEPRGRAVTQRTRLIIAPVHGVTILAVPAYYFVAVTHYVATSGGGGSDSNDGLAASVGGGHGPYLTMSYATAAARLACTDTLYIRTGTYDGGFGIVGGGPTTFCSSWGSSITVSAYTPDSGASYESVTLTSTGNSSVIGLFSGSTACAAGTTLSAYWQIKHITLDGTGGANDSSTVNGNSVGFIRFDSVTAIHAKNSGFFTSNCSEVYDVDGWELLNVECKNFSEESVTTTAHHCVYLSHMKNFLLDGGSYHDGEGYGIQLNCVTCIARNARVFNTDGFNIGNGAGNLVYNMLCYDNELVGIQLTQLCHGCGIYHNTVVANPLGIYVAPGNTGAILRNNIVWGNSSINIDDAGQGTVVANNFTNDPSFTNTVGRDLTLTSISGAIGYGANLAGAAGTTDFVGATRLGPNPSAGAYDFGGMASPHLVSVSPVSLVQGATAQNLTFTGGAANFTGSSVGSLGCSGVTINSTTLVDSLHVTVNVTVAGGAAVATCSATVTTGGEVATGSSLFSVTSSGTASLSSISPATGAQGTTFSTAVVGVSSTFVNGTTNCAIGAPTTGITINSTTVSDSTHLTVNITLTPGVATGVRNFTCTTVANGAITTTNGFTVTAAALCATGIVNGQCVHHSNDSSGSSTWTSPNLPVSVSTVAGHYNFILITTVKSSPASVTTNRPVASVTSALGLTYISLCSSATNLTFQQEILGAPVTTGGTEHVVVDYGATVYYTTGELVEVAGLDTTTAKDVCGKATGTSATPSVTLDSTTTVDNDLVLAVISNLSGDIPVTVSPFTLIESVPGNNFSYKVQSPVGTTVASWTQPSAQYFAISIALKPNTATPPSISVVSASSCAQVTATCTINLTGVNTHWTSNSVPTMSDLGGIATTSFTRNSATSATWVVSVSGGASLTTRDVTVTEGEEVATKAASFTVTYTQQARFTPFHWRF